MFSSELLPLVSSYDIGQALVQQIWQIIGVNPAQTCVVDSKSVWNSFVRMAPITEENLAADTAMLREAHANVATE